MGATDAAFAGSIPGLYEQYLGSLLFQPFAEDVASRMNGLSRGRVLETAAGTGIVTRMLDKHLPPEVEIVATDLNPGMLDLAQTKLQSPRVTWQQTDAQTLPFEDGSFDAVVCQFGVMFFPDKQAAYREALRVLKPDGFFLFSVWDKLDANPMSKAVSDHAIAQFPNDPPRFFERTPFGHSDENRLRDELQRAGFGSVSIERVEKRSQAPSARDAAMGLTQGTPLRGELEARAPGRLDEMTEKATEALAKLFGNGSFENRMSALVVRARR
ncbi:class I SAM-dependent methyltransferase [Microvirga solisilvae]|uniref:class I SAM-dependent methyltransferase n=1 Tax=Microvirga solisilvae TaxID=2919498 RepID=UPI001FAF8961|nr:methyltransferase domain-containing protein [Microvirga solisilvae]